MVAWFDNTADGAGNPGIRFRVYDDAGNGGAVRRANTHTAGVQDSPAITALADGGFVIAWRDEADTSIKAARFGATGNAVGNQVRLSNFYDDSDPALALLNDGRFIAAYTMTNGLGNAQIYETIWDPRTSPIEGTSANEIIAGRRDAAELRGLEGADTLVGYDGNDTLDGGAGIDDMRGGKGNDTYWIDSSSDKIFERPDEGIDTVTTALDNVRLGTTLENLVLLPGAVRGRGNSQDNTITGNSLANLLHGDDGNDTLNGGSGADEMRGGLGNDSYYADSSGDRIIERPGEGIDTVYTSVTNLTLGANIENLTLLEAGIYLTRGRGNKLDNTITGNNVGNLLQGEGGNDTLIGNGGADELRGMAGNDSMIGGSGNDTYFVDRVRDVVVETNRYDAGDADKVYSQIDYTLGANVEGLYLQGVSNLSGTGNELSNFIYGNEGDNLIQGMAGYDRIDGGDGNDTIFGGASTDMLEGGLGADTYVITADSDTDIIVDFDPEFDRFDLSGVVFTKAKIVVRVHSTDTWLTHTGGVVRVEGIANTSLEFWNSLVVSESQAIEARAASDWHDAFAGRTVPLTGGDWFLA